MSFQTQLFSDKGLYEHLGPGPFVFLGRKHEINPLPGCPSNSPPDAIPRLQRPSTAATLFGKEAKKVFQIAVDDPLLPALNLFPYLTHGVLRRPPSSISEVGIIQYRLEDWLQPIEQRLLAYPFVNRRNSHRAKLTRPARLRDLHLPNRLRLIGVLSQFPLQSVQLLTKLRRKLFQALPIHASTPPVCLHTLPGDLQILLLVYFVH